MQRMTWEEMQKKYPDEWLMIVDYETDTSGRLVSGIIERHSKSKDVVYTPPAPRKSMALRYTGESTFCGLRSLAERDHHI